MSAPSVDLSRYRTVVVSPHFDDAALSLSAVLMTAPGPVAVVTVHGGRPPAGVKVSSWDYDCGFSAPEDAYETRVREDALACECLGADQILLVNPDSPYRQPDEPLVGLDELVRRAAATADLYLPAGINQPDHGRVRDQSIAALGTDSGVRPFFYADLPYAAALSSYADEGSTFLTSPEAWPSEVRVLGGRYEHGLDLPRGVPVTGKLWEAKRRAVLCHASQLSLVACMDEVAVPQPLLGVDGLLALEVVWRPSAG
ncbi:PIG-L family deacetylase [Streptomyces sp. NPDC047081]|uniref:PIG-L deacetylase family protein n=1 Tax=Streptomyces sp. NPDC047081 TaxID=3154706 RepID=UPI00340E31C3